MATQPSLRIGDREREATAAELREHFAHGRLSQEEFNQRLDAVFAAKTQRDLSRITSDLPHVRTGGAPLPSARTNPGQRFTAGPAAGASSGGYPVGLGSPGRDWSGQGGRHGGFAVFATLLAAIASWLLVYDVILAGWQVPWAGRAGLLVAIFTLIRGLLRRIFRRGRRKFW